jgi:trk system potassium uptake protein TrkH
MKTTTLAVLAASVVSTFKRRKSVEMFGRRLEDNITSLAMCVFVMYFVLAGGGAVVISTIDEVPFINALFESTSAVATVGLTTGITSSLGIVSSIMLMLFMLFGRVGSITMLLAFSSYKSRPQSQRPLEKIQIG